MDVDTLLAQTAPDIVGALVGAPAKAVTEVPIYEPKAERALVAMSGLQGDLNGVLSVRCSHETAEKLFDHVVQGNAAKTEDAIRDLVAEVLNLLVGQLKANLAYQGKSVRHSLPSVFSEDEQDGPIDVLGGSSPIILETEVGPLEIQFTPIEESF
ncbi:MAG: chemotaxis protein CheX [Calditrichaeota bacterium]|nr:chemotaxis protein CheX [Calditrichota bacterium]